MRIASGLFVSLTVSTLAACSHGPTAPSADASKRAAAAACPEAVTQSIAKEFPGAARTSCKAEHADGHDQFEVKLTHGGEPVEVDVAPNGTILQTEVTIPLDKVPAKVMAAFTAKYPNATPTRVEKQIRAGKGAFYELAFPAKPTSKEVTFAEDGSFVEEE